MQIFFIIAICLIVGMNLATLWLLVLVLKRQESTSPSAPDSVFFTIDGKRMVTMQLKDSEKVTLALEFDDAKGFPVNPTLDAAPAWNVVDASIGTLQVAQDGLSADFIAQKPGTTQVQFSCSISGKAFSAQSEDLVVIAGDAVSVQLKVAAPIAQ